LDDLLLQRGFADLSGATQYRHWRQTAFQSLQDMVE
jgi:hypothetical protein